VLNSLKGFKLPQSTLTRGNWNFPKAQTPSSNPTTPMATPRETFVPTQFPKDAPSDRLARLSNEQTLRRFAEREKPDTSEPKKQAQERQSISALDQLQREIPIVPVKRSQVSVPSHLPPEAKATLNDSSQFLSSQGVSTPSQTQGENGGYWSVTYDLPTRVQDQGSRSSNHLTLSQDGLVVQTDLKSSEEAKALPQVVQNGFAERAGKPLGSLFQETASLGQGFSRGAAKVVVKDHSAQSEAKFKYDIHDAGGQRIGRIEQTYQSKDGQPVLSDIFYSGSQPPRMGMFTEEAQSKLGRGGAQALKWADSALKGSGARAEQFSFQTGTNKWNDFTRTRLRLEGGGSVTRTSGETEKTASKASLEFRAVEPGQQEPILRNTVSNFDAAGESTVALLGGDAKTLMGAGALPAERHSERHSESLTRRLETWNPPFTTATKALSLLATPQPSAFATLAKLDDAVDQSGTRLGDLVYRYFDEQPLEVKAAELT
jgi:hypothetical protein